MIFRQPPIFHPRSRNIEEGRGRSRSSDRSSRVGIRAEHPDRRVAEKTLGRLVEERGRKKKKVGAVLRSTSSKNEDGIFFVLSAPKIVAGGRICRSSGSEDRRITHLRKTPHLRRSRTPPSSFVQSSTHSSKPNVEVGGSSIFANEDQRSNIED